MVEANSGHGRRAWFVRNRKVTVKMCVTVLKMRITCKQKCDQNVCESWNVRCAVYKVEIISLAFQWLIVLRSAIKTRDQTHRVLKNVFVAS